MPQLKLLVDDATLVWIDASQLASDLLYVGGQAFVGMLPWAAMAIAHGKITAAPTQHLRAFGGGSGLLAFAFAPAHQRVTFGDAPAAGVTTEPTSAAAAADAPSPLTATGAAQSAWNTLFPR